MDILKYIKQQPFFIPAFICLCMFTMNQTYTLVWEYQEGKKQILQEIDKNRDVTSYIVYYEVISTEENFSIEKDITLVSDSEVFEIIDIVWVDILRCDLYDGNWFVYFSLSETKDYNVQVGRKLSPWRYGWDIPKQPAECYIDGTVKITTELWNKKALPIESNTFTIWAE